MPKKKKKIEKPFSVGLIELRTDLNPELMKEDNSLFYAISINSPEDLDEEGLENSSFFTTSIECGKRHSDATSVSVSAHYLCFFEKQPRENDLDRAMEIARFSCWQRFSVLFGFVTSQMNLQFPTLPNDPGEVVVADEMPE